MRTSRANFNFTPDTRKKQATPRQQSTTRRNGPNHYDSSNVGSKTAQIATLTPEMFQRIDSPTSEPDLSQAEPCPKHPAPWRLFEARAYEKIFKVVRAASRAFFRQLTLESLGSLESCRRCWSRARERPSNPNSCHRCWRRSRRACLSTRGCANGIEDAS